MDTASFLNTSILQQVRPFVLLLPRIDQASGRKALAWALHYAQHIYSSDAAKSSDFEKQLQEEFQAVCTEILEKDSKGEIIPMQASSATPGIRKEKKRAPLTEEDIATLCSGCFVLVRSAIRSRVKPVAIEGELIEMKIPEVFVADFLRVVTKNAESLSKGAAATTPSFPKIEETDWRVDIGISSSSMMKILRPTVTMRITLSNGEIKTFEMDVEGFQQLRYNTAKALQHIEDAEKLPILKIDAEAMKRAAVGTPGRTPSRLVASMRPGNVAE